MGNLHFTRRGGLIAAAVAAGLGILPTAQAIDFNVGDARGSWDTTFSYGQAWRLRRSRLQSHRHRRRRLRPLPNIDDGDLNYDPGRLQQGVQGGVGAVTPEEQRRRLRARFRAL